MTSQPTIERVVRARAAFVGQVVGDALGAAVEGMSAERARDVVANELMPAAPSDHPFWPLQPAGTTTDDTALSVLLSRRLRIDGPIVDSFLWTADLAEWVAAEDAAGRGAYIGPSTRQAVLQPASDGSGSPGMTNGSAMRSVPIGIALSQRFDLLVESVVAAGRPAHDSDVAHAASASVAAAVAAGVAGHDIESAIKLALTTAEQAWAFGFRSGRTPYATTLRTTLRHVVRFASRPAASRYADLVRLAADVGTGVNADESVVMAFAVALLERDDAWAAARLGASLGGDTDTLAGLSAAIVAATSGSTPPPNVLRALPPYEIERAEDTAELLLRII